MRYLLDTHIWVWMHDDSPKLNAAVRAALAASAAELWLSPISVWEVLLLADKRRLTLMPDPMMWVAAALIKTAIKEAPFTLEVASELYRFDLPHGDPGDRFLVATARVYDLTLVTADARLLRIKGLSTLANR